MAIKSSSKNFGKNRSINYIGKDFATFKQNLIDFSKTYFPDSYTDFNETSPGMIFIEMASYIGDVLSFYQDVQLKESLLTYASERKNVVALAQAMGYKPKISTPAVTNITVYQLVPSIGTGANNRPDETYFLKIKDGLQVSSTTNQNIIFRTIQSVDFANPVDREISIYSRNATTCEPDFYLISKKVEAISATSVSTTVSFATNDTNYPSFTLNDSNLISVESIYEQSTNDKWYEVPYLAQESVFVENANTTINGQLSEYVDNVPYILEIKKVPKRYCVKVNSNNTFDIQFGSGNNSIDDEIVLPNPKNIGNRLNTSIDPSNFLKTSTFGIAPAGKTLIINYLKGGGVESNVNTGDLTTIKNIEFEEDLLSISNTTLYNTVKASVAVENLEPAVGGRGAESIEEIRQNALAMFGTQNRAVTRQDYTVRALSMPERYGSVAKVYVSADQESDDMTIHSLLQNPKTLNEFSAFIDRVKNFSKQDQQIELAKFVTSKKADVIQKNNPFAINLYLLSYDSNKKLTNSNPAVKENLKTYLGEHRMVTDAVNIIDGYIVNIGVDFDIIVYSNYNKREVLANCITELTTFFNIDNWTFNKPINISEIELILANVEGVMSVPKVEIFNLHGEAMGYSNNRYNVPQATVGKIVYPSLDPCVFEVKYPNKDIKGRAL